MKIAVNTRLLLPNNLEGIGWFTYEVFKRLSLNHPDIEWVFIFDRPYDPSFIFSNNVKPVVIGPPSRHPILWYLWFEFSIPRILKKEKPDLFISPDGYLSLRTNCPSLSVIHDINFEHNPENIPNTARKYLRKYFPKFAEKALRIATVSDYSKMDISKTYGVNQNRIDLVYNGTGDFFHPLNKEKSDAVRSELSSNTPYFIFVGALNPRKNITGMLNAYSAYKKEGGENKFVIVGKKMFWNEEISNTYENHPFKEDIIFTGRLEGDALNSILGAAEALLFVSNFEGFGIPIVEAFKCRVPVITSSTSSMPEVAGDAAIICDPKDLKAICKAMHDICIPEIRNSLIEKGVKRQKLFTWENSAEMMWSSIEKCFSEINGQ